MNKYYFSFGSGQTCRINGITWDVNSLMVLRAESECGASSVVRNLTNNRYCTSYTQKRIDEDPNFMQWFPRGMIELESEFRT